jgi:predicted RNA binding protein YcfA (HicA-like mRNA interferase family)
MPHFGPIKRRNLIAALRRAGFVGPDPGGSHQLMRRGTLTLAIPNPHQGDIGLALLKQILKQAGLSRADWERL